MATAKEILGSDEYWNYRNVRAAAVMFVLIGSIAALGAGIAVTTGKMPNPNDSPALWIGVGIIGLAGAVGGVAALRGSRRWAGFVYVMAVPWLFCFPIGTIMSWVILTGLSRYLDSKERIWEARLGDPWSAVPGDGNRHRSITADAGSGL